MSLTIFWGSLCAPGVGSRGDFQVSLKMPEVDARGVKVRTRPEGRDGDGGFGDGWVRE